MIWEAIRYLSTPCPQWARRLGYLKEAIGIDARYKRCKASWVPHLDNTCQVILASAARCERRRTALIAGSGLCLDLPLAELAEMFGRVVLLDAVHLPAAKKHGLRNVEHVSLDVTGLTPMLSRGLNHLPDVPEPEFYHIFPDVDFVVSLNLASQLPLMPVAYLTKRGLLETDEAAAAYSQTIIDAHFRWLAGFKAVRCLVADRRWDVKGVDGRPIRQDDPLYGISLPGPDRLWTWAVAPRGELTNGQWRENLVAGYMDFSDYASQ